MILYVVCKIKICEAYNNIAFYYKHLNFNLSVILFSVSTSLTYLVLLDSGRQSILHCLHHNTAQLQCDSIMGDLTLPAISENGELQESSQGNGA